MKLLKNVPLLSLCFGFLFLAGCSNDFEVSAPWKDIPIAYGLLDIADETHYIRVEKAFLDPDRSALEIAQDPDSLYYENAIVQLQKVGSGQTFDLTRVNGNDPGIGLPRDPGIFATDPNILYAIPASQIDLEPGDQVRLIIERGDGLPTVTAQTTIQSPLQKRTPGGTNFDFVPNLMTRIGWSASKEAKIFDAKLIIHYAEYPRDNPSALVEKQIDWVWAKGQTFTVTENEYRLEKSGSEFYNVLASSIPNDPNFVRIFIRIDMEVLSGGEELEKYISVALANSGLTGSQELPSFSNLSEGLGVFSTKGKLLFENFSLSTRTRDSLIMGSITKQLNFQ